MTTPAEAHFDAVLAEQRAKGRAKYGKGLDHTEGRDWNRMALEEAVDLAQYLAAENLRLREAPAALDRLRNTKAHSVGAVLDAVRQIARASGWSAGEVAAFDALADRARADEDAAGPRMGGAFEWSVRTPAEDQAAAFRAGAKQMQDRAARECDLVRRRWCGDEHGIFAIDALDDASGLILDLPLNGCGGGVHEPCPGCECACHGGGR